MATDALGAVEKAAELVRRLGVNARIEQVEDHDGVWLVVVSYERSVPPISGDKT